MSGRATLATARLRLATAATRISAARTRPGALGAARLQRPRTRSSAGGPRLRTGVSPILALASPRLVDVAADRQARCASPRSRAAAPRCRSACPAVAVCSGPWRGVQDEDSSLRAGGEHRRLGGSSRRGRSSTPMASPAPRPRGRRTRTPLDRRALAVQDRRRGPVPGGLAQRLGGLVVAGHQHRRALSATARSISPPARRGPRRSRLASRRIAPRAPRRRCSLTTFRSLTPNTRSSSPESPGSIRAARHLAYMPGLAEPPEISHRGPAEVPPAPAPAASSPPSTAASRSKPPTPGWSTAARPWRRWSTASPHWSSTATAGSTSSAGSTAKTPVLAVWFAKQNLPPIVYEGHLDPDLSDGPESGATVINAVRVWRSRAAASTAAAP